MQDYKPRFPWWRLVLICRKLCLVIVTVLASSNPMFQASICVGVLAVGYGLHAKHQPFVSPSAQDEVALARMVTPQSGPSRPRRRSIGDVRNGAKQELTKLADFNVLETVLLASCVAIILGGMIFESAQFPVGSGMYVALTIAVCGVMICSLLLFVWMLKVEVERTCKQSKGTSSAAAPKASSSAAKPTTSPNPVFALSRIGSPLSRDARLQRMHGVTVAAAK